MGVSIAAGADVLTGIVGSKQAASAQLIIVIVVQIHDALDKCVHLIRIIINIIQCILIAADRRVLAHQV